MRLGSHHRRLQRLHNRCLYLNCITVCHVKEFCRPRTRKAECAAIEEFFRPFFLKRCPKEEEEGSRSLTARKKSSSALNNARDETVIQRVRGVCPAFFPPGQISLFDNGRTWAEFFPRSAAFTDLSSGGLDPSLSNQVFACLLLSIDRCANSANISVMRM